MQRRSADDSRLTKSTHSRSLCMVYPIHLCQKQQILGESHIKQQVTYWCVRIIKSADYAAGVDMYWWRQMTVNNSRRRVNVHFISGDTVDKYCIFSYVCPRLQQTWASNISLYIFYIVWKTWRGNQELLGEIIGLIYLDVSWHICQSSPSSSPSSSLSISYVQMQH